MYLFPHTSAHSVSHPIENDVFEHYVAVFKLACWCCGGFEPVQEGFTAFVGNDFIGAAGEVEDAFVLESGL